MARKAKKKSDSASRLPSREHVVRVLTTATTIILTLSLAAGLLIGRGPLQARAAQAVREPVRVAFSWPPLVNAAGEVQPGTWLDPATQRHLQALAQQYISPDPFDGAGLARAREALAATGWFATGKGAGEGPILRRESAGVVRVEGRWRVPFAAVRTGTGPTAVDRLVTFRGEVLDKAYAPGTSGQCVIINAEHPAPSRLGDVWAGADVHAALALIATLRHKPWADQIAAIDVGAYTPRGQRQLWIVTKTGGRIRWGGPVDAPLPGEQSTAVKIRHLDTIAARSGGRLDGGQAALDIRLKDVLIDATGAPPINPPTSPGPSAIPSGR
jgi:hypothetical protein